MSYAQAEAAILFAMMQSMMVDIQRRMAGQPDAAVNDVIARAFTPERTKAYTESMMQELAERVGGLRIFRLDEPSDRATVRRLLVQAYRLHINGQMPRKDVISVLANELSMEDEYEEEEPPAPAHAPAPSQPPAHAPVTAGAPEPVPQ